MALFGQPRKDDTAGAGRAEGRAEDRPAPVAPPPPRRSRREPPNPSDAWRTSRCRSARSRRPSPPWPRPHDRGQDRGQREHPGGGPLQGHRQRQGRADDRAGAAVDGEVKADTVLVGGEVRGHIISKSRVEFKESGTLIGDLKAGSLTVAAGSKMRGKVEFGWKEGEIESAVPPEAGAASADRNEPSRPSGLPGGTRVTMRGGPPGDAWNCPHCGERILRSAVTCPACQRHLRFDAVAAGRPGTTAVCPLEVEGTVRHPPTRAPGNTRSSSRSTTSGGRGGAARGGGGSAARG